MTDQSDGPSLIGNCPRCKAGYVKGQYLCRECGRELPAVSDGNRIANQTELPREIYFLRGVALLNYACGIYLILGALGKNRGGIDWNEVGIGAAVFVSGVIVRSLAGMWGCLERIARK